MSNTLPSTVHPLQLAARGRTLRGRLPIAAMPRLRRSLCGAEPLAGVELNFACDEHGVPRVRGAVSATVEVVCQRCLEPMRLALRAQVRLRILRGEAGGLEPGAGDEPLEGGENPVPLAELVEDELILALPPYPVHAAAECAPPGGREARPAAEPPARQRPFAALADMKTR